MFTNKNRPTEDSMRTQLVESLRKRYLDGTLDEVLFHDGVNVDRLCAAIVQERPARSRQEVDSQRPPIVANQPEILR